jgi:hypothetical protein
MNTNTLDMTGKPTGKSIIAEGLYRMSPFTLIYPSGLLPNCILIWSTSVLSEHKIALLMQCLESVRNTLFPDISLISDAMPRNYFLIASIL